MAFASVVRKHCNSDGDISEEGQVSVERTASFW